MLRRSNVDASVFGATVALNGPRDGTVFGLDLNAQAARVDRYTARATARQYVGASARVTVSRR